MGTTRLWWPLIEPDRAFIDGWHLGCIAEHLEEIANPFGCMRNLIINVPPRFSKSVETCVYWFAHEWRKRPTSRWMYSSFSHENVRRDSLRCRDIVRHPLYRYLSAIDLKEDQNTQMRFTNQYQGFRYGVTVAGQGMGEGADFIVVDDPQSPKQSISPAERAKVIHWWRSTMSRRSVDERTVRKVIIMQRLHEMDLTGYILAEEYGWDHLVLPMRYEPRRYFFADRAVDDAKAAGEFPKVAVSEVPISGAKLAGDVADLVAQFSAAVNMDVKELVAKDTIRPTALQKKNPKLIDGPGGSGREENGQILWPERFPEEAVAAGEQSLGPEQPGQYQQRPSAEAGDVFERDRFRRWQPYTEVVENPETGEMEQVLGGVDLAGPEKGQVRRFRMNQLTAFQTIDTALTEGLRSAFTVCGTMLATPDHDLIVWNIFRAKMNVQYQLGALFALREGKVAWHQKSHTITPGPAWPFRIAFQAVEKKASGVGLIQEAASAGKPFHPLIADKDKVQRATSVATLYVNSKVYHPHPSQVWVVELEDELAAFPNGKYADQVDVVAYAGILLTHDKILRGLCSGRRMAEAPSPEQLLADQKARGNVYEFGFGSGSVKVEFPDDDIFGAAFGR